MMGLLNPNQRVLRVLEEDHYDPSRSPTASPSSNAHNSNKKCSNLLPLILALVFVAEIGFLGRLDLIKNANFVNSWAESFYQFTTSPLSSSSSIHTADDAAVLGFPDASVGAAKHGGGESCEAWLEREDRVVYSRDFRKEPVRVIGGSKDWKSCAVECKFVQSGRHGDAALGLPREGGMSGVIRSMESSRYYPEIRIPLARRKGFDVIMTTSLSSDVPVGYFSWAEYDLMAPVQPKTEKALAAAFISNCDAHNFRLRALEGLEESNVTIDSYGGCHHNRDGNVDKVEALRHYKFSLAFENSNEEDYVTEKFFQSLVAGSVPVVFGAPNIQDFAPSPSSVLHIKELKDIASVAKTMKYLGENATAYNESLRWKYEGPSDSFKALVDMAAVHSSCRLCIFLATKIREKEEKSPGFRKRPCKCGRGWKSVYHVYVRERGRFEMESIFLRSGNLSIQALESAVLSKFKARNHEPIWRKERPESIRGDRKALKIHRVYPVGMTQRQALYTFGFKGSSVSFRSHVESNPCAKFEVIFV